MERKESIMLILFKKKKTKNPTKKKTYFLIYKLITQLNQYKFVPIQETGGLETVFFLVNFRYVFYMVFFSLLLLSYY